MLTKPPTHRGALSPEADDFKAQLERLVRLAEFEAKEHMIRFTIDHFKDESLKLLRQARATHGVRASRYLYAQADYTQKQVAFWSQLLDGFLAIDPEKPSS